MVIQKNNILLSFNDKIPSNTYIEAKNNNNLIPLQTQTYGSVAGFNILITPFEICPNCE